MLTIETYRPEIFPDLIERLWIAENKEKEVELVIPPNQYVNLIFALNNSTYKRNHVRIDKPQIEGIAIRNTTLTYPAGTRLIGVRFFAFGLYPFLQIHGRRIFNNSLHFPNESQKITGIIEYSEEDLETVLIYNIYEMLHELFCEKSYNNVLQIIDFYNQFRWNDKTLSIEEYCKTSETNYTTLNRNFAKIIGTTPKIFERLIKFRKSLCSLTGSDNNLTSIGAHSGYFDQSHFIREFKIFLNQTPSDYQASLKLNNKAGKIINYNFKLL